MKKNVSRIHYLINNCTVQCNGGITCGITMIIIIIIITLLKYHFSSHKVPCKNKTECTQNNYIINKGKISELIQMKQDITMSKR